MSKIKFEHIDENEVAIVIDSNVPLSMVEQLTKSLEAKGLVEDKANSSITHRFFYRPESAVNDVADQLIKSLREIAKDEGDSPYSKEARRRNSEKNRVNDRRKAAGMSSLNEAQIAANKSPAPKAPAAPVAKPAPDIDLAAWGSKPKHLHDPQLSGKVNYKKSEDEDDDVEKSNYGPKKAGLYNPADNARRKANNMDPVGVGPNVNAKAYSTKPGQMSGKAQASLSARIQAAANKKQPVRRFTPEEIEAENKKRGLKKHSWGQHLPFPSAEEEIMKLAKASQTQLGEDALANQLANVMVGKAMLGQPPPAQPTDEQLFGHLVVTEEMAKANEQKWQGAAFNWLAEAAKPISQKFASEEEELAYWNSIKVSDKDDGKPGY